MKKLLLIAFTLMLTNTTCVAGEENQGCGYKGLDSSRRNVSEQVVIENETSTAEPQEVREGSQQ